jgi:hypothetical protein
MREIKSNLPRSLEGAGDGRMIVIEAQNEKIRFGKNQVYGVEL